MIVLDTNVLSEFLKQTPEPSVVKWAESVEMETLWLTTISVFEIRYGLNIMDAGKRRTGLTDAFNRTLEDDFANRILDFNCDAAEKTAEIATHLKVLRRVADSWDVQIAGIVSQFDATLATRNTKHFVDTGVNLVDPWMP